MLFSWIRRRKAHAAFPQDKQAGLKVRNVVIKNYRIFKGQSDILMLNFDRFNFLNSFRWNRDLVHQTDTPQLSFLLYKPLTALLDKR